MTVTWLGPKHLWQLGFDIPLPHFLLSRERDTVIGECHVTVTHPGCCVTEERDRETAKAIAIVINLKQCIL